MRRFILAMVVLFIGFFSYGQQDITWDGGGGNTDWTNATNWNPDQVPGATDTVLINTVATITGATGTVAQMKISDVVDLSGTLTIGDGVSDVNSLVLNSDGDLTFSSGTLTINPGPSNNGISIFKSAANASLTINSGATINSVGGSTGINLVNATSSITNNGTLNISGVSDDAIKMADGTFTNNGSLSAMTAGTGQSGDAALDQVGGVFNNLGTFDADGGTSGNPRAIQVDAGATLNNYNTIVVSGGNLGRSISNDGGTITNHKCAIIDLTNTRMNNNTSGTFTNNGYITSTATQAMLNGATAINNGFYSGAFAGWTNDNGVDVTTNPLILDFAGSCTYDLNGGNTGMQEYYWSYTSNFDTTGADGVLDVSFAGLPNETGPTTIMIADDGCESYNTEFTIQVSNVCADALITLPIELVSISAQSMSTSIMVKWQTASEVNNDYMAVERSTDGFNFAEIGRVAGAGNSSSIQNYELEDAAPAAGVNYYRLRQVDYDGSMAYSEVVSAEYMNTVADISIAPNVARNFVNVKLDGNISELYLSNQTGQQLAIYHMEERQVERIDISHLPQGTYFLSFRNGKSFVTKRFLKQ